ncbi:AMP-binding protein [Salinispora arenicola]|uniref:AMP-binding protein n=1 Tax=Salinispora arenicola TaxID=168697 RepID=UPI0027DE8C66|nr:AMP-binding protein [Salinispora arenicola]
MAEAERISAGLAAHGVGPRAVVGLAATTLCDTVTAILAILRRGAAYLPLDPGLPAQRLEYMVRRAGCEFIVGETVVPGVPTVTVADLTPRRSRCPTRWPTLRPRSMSCTRRAPPGSPRASRWGTDRWPT